MIAVKLGDLVKIIYLGKGEAKSGKNAPKLFDVYIDYEQRDKTMAEVEAEVAPATQVATQEVAPAAPAPTPAPTV